MSKKKSTWDRRKKFLDDKKNRKTFRKTKKRRQKQKFG